MFLTIFSFKNLLVILSHYESRNIMLCTYEANGEYCESHHNTCIATVIYKTEVIQLKKSPGTPIALLQLGQQEIQHPDPG